MFSNGSSFQELGKWASRKLTYLWVFWAHSEGFQQQQKKKLIYNTNHDKVENEHLSYAADQKWITNVYKRHQVKFGMLIFNSTLFFNIDLGNTEKILMRGLI